MLPSSISLFTSISSSSLSIKIDRYSEIREQPDIVGFPLKQYYTACISAPT